MNHKILRSCKKKLADAHKETIRVRNYWFQVLEDMLLEFEKAQKKADAGTPEDGDARPECRKTKR